MKLPRATEWTVGQPVFLSYYTLTIFGGGCIYFILSSSSRPAQSSGHQLIPFQTSILSVKVISLLLRDQFCPHARWDNSMCHMLSNLWSNMVGTQTQARWPIIFSLLGICNWSNDTLLISRELWVLKVLQIWWLRPLFWGIHDEQHGSRRWC